MCDLAYVSLLREKVRQRDAEEKRVATFGTPPRAHFIPWIMLASRNCRPCDGGNSDPALRNAARHNNRIYSRS
jgi:hypothetical protein